MNRLPAGAFFPRNYFSSLNWLLALAVLMVSLPASAQFKLKKISVDTFTDNDAQHATEVEPDTFGYGSTIVSAFQVARISDGGGADVGFSTSTDGGKTWTAGYLPGLTHNYQGGSFSAASDASVAYDAAHGMWLISTLPIGNNDLVAVSRSADGITWGTPIMVTSTINSDKNWIVCDNTATSPFYGHCYVEWDSPAEGDLVFMSTSTDGGQTWGQARNTADSLQGIGGQPLVQPNGNVVVPIVSLFTGGVAAFSSTNGGSSWGTTVNIATIEEHGEAGGIRSPGLPTADIDGAGNIYLIWSDCRFRKNCTTNDLVMSTSANGTKWTSPARLPMVPLSSAVDLFIPGLGVDHATSGASAHLAVTTYAYSDTNCNQSTCKLYVGFTTSKDGGKTWTAGKVLAGPMSLSWLPNSQNGLMVADYLSVSFANGKPYGVFAVANAKVGGKFDEAMYTNTTTMLASADEPTYSSAGEKPIPGVKSDKGPRKFYDLDNEYPIPPKRMAARRSSKK